MSLSNFNSNDGSVIQQSEVSYVNLYANSINTYNSNTSSALYLLEENQVFLSSPVIPPSAGTLTNIILSTTNVGYNYVNSPINAFNLNVNNSQIEINTSGYYQLSATVNRLIFSDTTSSYAIRFNIWTGSNIIYYNQYNFFGDGTTNPQDSVYPLVLTTNLYLNKGQLIELSLTIGNSASANVTLTNGTVSFTKL